MGCTWYDFIDCGRFVYAWVDSNWSSINWWMVTFALAHCFGVKAFLQTGISWNGFWIGLLVYGLFLIIFLFSFIRNEKQDKLFTIGALIYGLWVGGMACFVFALYYENTGIWWIPAFGGLLFVISSYNKTDTEKCTRSIISLLIWFTYVAAQMCIVYVDYKKILSKIVDRLF